MTSAERQRKCRAAWRAFLDSLTEEQKFRSALMDFLEDYQTGHSIAEEALWDSMEKCSVMLMGAAYMGVEGRRAVEAYLWAEASGDEMQKLLGARAEVFNAEVLSGLEERNRLRRELARWAYRRVEERERRDGISPQNAVS
jgi:hypothetical protein